ncbi:fimbrial protein [Enterobacteriaceae bacterium H20N1]|uniref:Fimbrial protein n=1 Tax=Dryocola boscaweniae TaxID=2925397 RepID=A0A9X2W6Y5_9ENTR|nr:fimbrial protein [Dryocola boscaweniae]MCT4702248.1 fimbrial protein [Dryocola boscaweniae]MCT4719308.1 fimbrial protein [Dryocola boscaweniae]
MKSLIRLGCILLLAGCYSQSSLAENCNASAGQTTINTQNITYLPTLPVNSQMTSQMPDNGGGVHFSCDLQMPTAGWKRIVYQQMDTSGAGTVINGHHVYATKLEGIGYSLGFQCNGGSIRYIDGSSAPAGNESTTVCDSSQLPGMLTQRELTVKMYITFFKTADVTLAGGNHENVDAQPQVGKLFIEQQAAGTEGTIVSSPTIIDLAALNVDIGSSGSCQVTTSSINVGLGTVNKAEFKGVNTVAGSLQSFAIPIFCSIPTDVKIGFFGVSADPALSDTLALNQDAQAAKGVGIRLSYGNNAAPAPAAGTAVKLNEASNLPVLKHITASSAGSAEKINFAAQYVQTGETISPGKANGIATFTLIYN